MPWVGVHPHTFSEVVLWFCDDVIVGTADLFPMVERPSARLGEKQSIADWGAVIGVEGAEGCTADWGAVIGVEGAEGCTIDIRG